MVLRIFKMIASSGFLTALECIIFVFGRGSTPDPTGAAYRAPPDSLTGLRGPISKGKEEEEGKGKEWEEPPPLRKFLDLSLILQIYWRKQLQT